MKLKSFIKLLVVLLLASGLVGCKKRKNVPVTPIGDHARLGYDGMMPSPSEFGPTTPRANNYEGNNPAHPTNTRDDVVGDGRTGRQPQKPVVSPIPVEPFELTHSERTGDLPEPGVWPTDANRDDKTLAADTVYFDLDQSAIRSTEIDKLNHVGDHLKNNSGHVLKIYGHCDERGTDGYNLALGERRAQATREYLDSIGVDATRIATVSMGESDPAAPGNNDAAYAQNRRCEFVLGVPRN